MNKRNILRTVTASATLAFATGVSAQALYISPSANVGVGTLSPTVAVDVVRSEAPANFRLTSFTDASNQAPQYIQRRSRGTFDSPMATSSGDLLGLISFRGHTGFDFTSTKAAITAKTTEAWSETANGTQLTFATTPNGSTQMKNVMEITNDGKVKINGSMLNVPDYVFEEKYKLMSLDELSIFIEVNKHLPGVASADEINSEGLDLAGSQLSVLEKVEELTLYTLDQHELLKKLKSENALLREKLEIIESQQAEMQAVMVKTLENQQAKSVMTSHVLN